MEWWAVSKWLADKLIECGHPVLDCEFGYWYGRTESGQHLRYDSGINKVAELLEA